MNNYRRRRVECNETRHEDQGEVVDLFLDGSLALGGLEAVRQT
jgi:hypothetical protein